MPTKPNPIKHALQEKRNVMAAVMLRDMRSRFFNHGLGFLMVPVWPLVHMMILLTLYSVLGRQTPYGESLSIFFATGLLPTLTFMYVTRGMAMSVLSNRNMLSFPVVTILDVMTARALLEIIGAFLTLVLLFSILLLRGEDPIPPDIFEAVFGYLSVLILAIGAGDLVGITCMIMKFFVTIWALFLIVLYLLSGVMFVPSRLPDEVNYYLSFNPIFQVVEWVRSAYYPGYGSRHLDKPYVLFYGITCLFLGLLVERLLRRPLLES